MSDERWRSVVKRRRLVKNTAALSMGGLLLGATGTAAADDGHNDSDTEPQRHEVSSDGDTVIELVEVLGDKFLFRTASEYRKKKESGRKAEKEKYEATSSGYAVEFEKVEPSITPSDIGSDGAIQVDDVDFTPGNYVEQYDVETKEISDSCGDIAFSSHNAIEFHFEGGGAFSSIGVSGVAAVVCYAAGASASIPTAGFSGALAAGVCGALTAAIDQAIDVDAIPNNAELSVAFWDQDENQIINTSPTIAVGLIPDYDADWDDVVKTGEYDSNVHLGLPG